MPTCTDITYHIVFGTKNRIPALDKLRRAELFRFIWGVAEERACHVYRIGGVEDHLHLLTSLHPTIALSSLVKEIKTASSAWIKGQHVFPAFDYWQEGSGAFTLSADARPALIDYIKGQEQHHARENYVQELQRMVHMVGLEWQPDYLP